MKRLFTLTVGRQRLAMPGLDLLVVPVPDNLRSPAAAGLPNAQAQRLDGVVMPGTRPGSLLPR